MKNIILINMRKSYGNAGFVDFGSKNNNVQVEETEECDSGEEDVIYVHIIGEVCRPGVIELKVGQRIIDAIELAGGTTELADLSKVNLAFVLSDGQQINIPSVYDDTSNFEYVIESGGDNVVIDERANGNKRAGKVNINTATQTELETLTGIGPSLASKIISYRQENGKFKNVEELKNVSGIGESKFESIKDEVCVR